MAGFRSTALVAVAFFMFHHASDAQDSTSSKGCGCFMGRPSPRCCSFLIIEGSWKFRTTDANYRSSMEDFQISYEFGIMFNRGTHYAYGGSLYWSADDDGSRWALRGRMRKWVTSKRALDLSAGIILGGNDNHVKLKLPGFVGTISYGPANWFSVSATFDAIRIGTKREFPDELPSDKETVWRTGLYLGGTLSHWPAIASPVVILILVAATWDQ